MKSLWRVLFISVSLFTLAHVHAAIDVYEFDNNQQEEQFKQLSQTLRCPKCQNNTISDSNAELAKDLRTKVYEMTKAGKSSDEIVDYMIARYGNFVTYKPPFTIATSVLWLGPLLVVLLGGGLIILNSRKKRGNAGQQSRLNDSDEARLNTLLADEQKQAKSRPADQQRDKQ